MPKAKFDPILAPFEKSLRLLNITQAELNEEIYGLNLPKLDPEIQFRIENDGIVIEDILHNPDITFTEPHGYILYKNRPMLVYIRDQLISRSDYEEDKLNKFHLCFCSSLETARRKNRLESRYIITTNTRGDFLLNIYIQRTNKPIEENVYKRLQVCQNCLRKLNWKDFNQYRGNDIYGRNERMRHSIVEDFSIDEFLETARHDLFSGAEKLLSNLARKEYSLSESVKAELKRHCDYKCQRCGKVKAESELQIHHSDHNQGNNSADNLMVVCIDCHNAIHRAEGGFLQKINRH